MLRANLLEILMRLIRSFWSLYKRYQNQVRSGAKVLDYIWIITLITNITTLKQLNNILTLQSSLLHNMVILSSRWLGYALLWMITKHQLKLDSIVYTLNQIMEYYGFISKIPCLIMQCKIFFFLIIFRDIWNNAHLEMEQEYK